MDHDHLDPLALLELLDGFAAFTDDESDLVAGHENFDGGGSEGATSVAHHRSSTAAHARPGTAATARVEAGRRFLVDHLLQQRLSLRHGIRRASQRALSLGT